MATLLTDIEAFLRANPSFSATSLGDRALGDRHFVRQLRNGRRVWPETEEKVRAFMLAVSPVESVDSPAGDMDAADNGVEYIAQLEPELPIGSPEEPELPMVQGVVA
jgi:hypothetical protein